MFTYSKVFRHVQLKALSKSFNKNPYAIHESLGGKAGAYVIWICYDKSTLQPCSCHMMGGRGNGKMRSLTRYTTAKNPRSKKERPGYRAVRIADANYSCLSLGDLVEVLFAL